GTRVVYGEITGTGTKSQSLDWEIGDKLTIYCAQCTKVQTDVESAKHVSDYVVTEVDPDETGSDSYAAIGNPGPDVEGLQWGDDVEHVFYAVYPKTSISGRTITGTIPQIQSVKSVSETASKVAAPYMTSMYMVSKTVVPASKVGDDVTLVFQPLTTALEFTVTNKFDDTFSAMIVNSISLVSTGHALSGGFAVDMDQNGSYGRPKTTLASGTTVADDNTVTIDFGDDPVTVAYGKTLTFTFFLNPGNEEDEVNDLTFVINGTNAGNSETFTRRAKLEDKDGHGVTFKTHQKTRISGLMVPEGVKWTINYNQILVTSWDNGIEDDLDME
ncbi:MAG: fimbrillin family protein, partial [Bacteroidaceae bacterium]|nr:fimbrillin family protein [Bacteroidaceae bacterium]